MEGLRIKEFVNENFRHVNEKDIFLYAVDKRNAYSLENVVESSFIDDIGIIRALTSTRQKQESQAILKHR